MKLIIDIPEDRYNLLKRVKEDKRSEFEDYVYYGTPLDDIKAEIQSKYEYQNGLITIESVLEIIDNHIGKEKE